MCKRTPVEEGPARVQDLTHLIRIGQVAIVDEVDAQGGVHKEGLCLLG